MQAKLVTSVLLPCGLGTRLLEEAERIAKQNGFKKLAVISAVGTRGYYMDRGFERGEYYLVKNIS